MKFPYCFLLLVVWLNTGTVLFAQEISAQEENSRVKLKFDLPLFDLPYQVDVMRAMDYGFSRTYTSPSMKQSLALTMSVYSSMHYGLKKMYDNLPFAPIWKNSIYISSTATGILALAYVLPFGYPWMASSYTRTIFSSHGIDSYDVSGSYHIGITDELLGQLKATAPYDFIRMNEANIEAYNLFSDMLARNSFFYDLENLSFVSAFLANWLNLNSMFPAIIYEYGLADPDSELIKLYYENDEGQSKRFIASIELVNWVYELFRPNEPYAARGQHPSGDGTVARYITFAQLSDNERAYLTRQVLLHHLNFLSPLLYGFRSFPLGNTGIDWNVALRHYVTSFGSDIPVNIFLKYKPFNIAFTWHNYQNYEHYFPAIETELIDFPLEFGKFKIYLSPRVLIGMQPQDQEFKTTSPEFMGLFGLRVDFNLTKHFLPYFDMSAKTNGWVAGYESLGADFKLITGVSLRF